MPLPTLFRTRRPSTWQDPFTGLERAMQRMFEELPAEMSEEGYPVDIDEVDDSLVVDAELPGFKKDEIDVRIHDDLLSIQAERSTEPPKGRPHLQERRFTRVQRSFRLPSAVDPDSVDANLEGGVLHIEMKKAQGEQTRKIEVK